MQRAKITLHLSIANLDLHRHIRSGKIRLAGNSRLKIFGQLNCRSGKRMNKKNRVFFMDENQAIVAGYRPCGHCMKKKYELWKTQRKDEQSTVI
ncbi:Ada metal-binding domain-containing protein [Reichenbachiella sp.]|uniref:Ada metal-binding domain-containing protein n=1 Tax=Reichenbachiella sp. TaxID=2184521 RepID=UPI003BAFAABA